MIFDILITWTHYYLWHQQLFVWILKMKENYFLNINFCLGWYWWYQWKWGVGLTRDHSQRTSQLCNPGSCDSQKISRTFMISDESGLIWRRWILILSEEKENITMETCTGHLRVVGHQNSLRIFPRCQRQHIRPIF